MKTAVTKLFPKETMQELACYGKVDGFNVISRDICDNDRWSISYKMLFTHDGKFYQSYYSKGATEYQDESPYEYDNDEIECTEVEPKEKTVIVYEPVAL